MFRRKRERAPIFQREWWAKQSRALLEFPGQAARRARNGVRNKWKGPCSWQRLPAEVRLLVLEWVAETPEQRPLAAYATVSREWQDFFESRTFRSLRLLPECLDEFDRVLVGPRRRHLRRVWLSIELRTRRVGGDGARFLTEVNKLALATATLYLFEILADWPEAETSPRGVTLELSAFSATDPKYAMLDSVPKEVDGLDLPLSPPPLPLLLPQWHSPSLSSMIPSRAVPRSPSPAVLRATGYSGVVLRGNSELDDVYDSEPIMSVDPPLGVRTRSGTTSSSPHSSAASNEIEHQRRRRTCLNSAETDPALDTELPAVPFVSELCLRRQSHADFFLPTIADVAAKLPGLRLVTLESWRRDGAPTLARDAKLVGGLVAALKSSGDTLRALRILEDHSEFYQPHCSARGYTPECAVLAQQLAEAAQDLGLETVALSNVVDAKDFFWDFWAPPSPSPVGLPTKATHGQWARLASLTLTSTDIRAGSPTGPVAGLLLAAGRAARHMPRLRLLEIYNGVGVGQGGLFRFEVGADCNSVVWESTWPFELPRDVVRAWHETAELFGTRRFRAEVRQMPAGLMRWPVCILPRLHSRRAVAHPITYCNMMRGYNVV